MAATLLALSQPIYKGVQAQRSFIKEHPEIAGKPLSMKRIKSIPYGFKAFGEGFIGGGGGERMGAMAFKGVLGKKKGGMVDDGKHYSMPSAMGGGHILAGMAGAGLVLGHLPAVALARERLRANGALKRDTLG